jgi:geranylgeranyl diphosphate synthase type II
MMHTYSLIHDDLPAMDNDDLRRGKPTSHKAFGEGVAILAGDALLTEAFAVIAQVDDTERYTVRDYVRELAATGGSTMLIGGQILDLEGERKQLSEPEVRTVYEGKTAALLTTALRFGGMSANATEAQLEALTDFGYNLGLAFQVIDDILDLTASTEKLGKTAGKDVNSRKSTCPSLIGLDGARSEAKCRTQAALDALMIFPEERRARLVELANYLLNREY